MGMATVTPATEIEGVLVVEPTVFADERGLFVESYRREWVPDGREMVQSNRGDRAAGCLVGLHYHLHQADYWYVASGHARVVLHDLRRGGPTDGATMALDLGEVDGGAHNHLALYIPPGVAHGFAALTDVTITYLVDGYYDPSDELGLWWADTAVGADWGVTEPLLSLRDQANPRRDQIPADLWPTAGQR
ncbi:MAG: dTDP-4-dehydrorhamnose 3,5-epimerase family protein [Actinomycetes bacterium]